MKTVKEARDRYRPKFKDWLRDLRKAKSLTLQDVADRCGCSKQNISMLESGQKLPTEESAVKLCEIYSVSPLEFLMRGGVMPAWLILHLAWDYYREFQEFLLSLEKDQDETVAE